MLRIDNPNQNHVLTITASGTLTQQDYADVVPGLETMLDQYDKLRFFIKLDEFSGIKPAAMWEELKFDMKHRSQFGKTAVIGDKKWEEWGTKVSKMFIPDEVKFFYPEQQKEAWDWVNQ